MKGRSDIRHGPYLLGEKQPFGVTHEQPMFPGWGVPAKADKGNGATTERFNSGVEQPQSNANKAPGAHAMASKGLDNPYNWVGHSFPSVATFVNHSTYPY